MVRIKCPDEICVGDRVWTWHPRMWVLVSRVERRRYGTAMLHLSDGRIVEAYVNKIVR